MSEPPIPATSEPIGRPASARTRADATAWTAVLTALAAVLLGYIATYVGPAATRQAAARGDYDNLFTYMAGSWSLAIALNLVALVLGIRGLRQPGGKALSGAAIALGATGILSFVVYMVVTFQVVPLSY
jgi:hypothetical protein